jgi:hypothetical protein
MLAELTHHDTVAMRLAFTDPTYFYATLWSTSQNLVRSGQISPDIVTWLKAQLVSSLNKALSSASITLSLGVMLTVATICMTEILVGDRELGSSIHRPAWAWMLAMTSCLQENGIPPLYYRHLKWADRMCARVTGITLVQLEPMLATSCWSSTDAEDIAEDVNVLNGFLETPGPS